jgi:hypothetical protein
LAEGRPLAGRRAAVVAAAVAVVALLAVLRDAVATTRERAVVGTAIVVDGVSVVTGLAGLERSVAAGDLGLRRVGRQIGGRRCIDGVQGGTVIVDRRRVGFETGGECVPRSIAGMIGIGCVGRAVDGRDAGQPIAGAGPRAGVAAG